MPAERDDPVVLVPLEPADGASATVDDQRGTDGPRKRWRLVAIVAGALLVAAVAVNSQLGDDNPSDDSGVAEDKSEATPEASSSDEAVGLDETSADSEPPAEPEPAASGDQPIDAGDEPGAGLSQAFGEPEHPVSGVEPYIPSRLRPVELGPPAEVCMGTLVAYRIQLPLRFASTKSEGIEQLTWSPDCRRVVFRIDTTLWLADGDGTGDMPFLTAQHGLNAPVWSPDTQWIAFSQDAIVEGERASHIFMVLPDGLGLAQITHGVVLDQDPAWSPDESRIAFARRVRVTEAEGDIRFEHHIVVADLLSGAEQVVSTGAERSSAPSWSPDGGAIAYQVGGDLRVVWLDDLSQSTLLVGVVGGRGSWSPDSSRVAVWRDWRRGRAEIAVLDRPWLYPGDEHVIVLEGLEQASPSEVPTLQWSADGQRLLFHSSDTPASHWAYSIVVPRPARSAEYWAMLDVAEAVVGDAGYEVVAVQHSVAVEAEFSVRGRAGEGVIEVWIALERSEPRRFFDAIENPHSELPGISRSPERIGVWFECDGLYGEVLAASQVTADALAADLMSAACPVS